MIRISRYISLYLLCLFITGHCIAQSNSVQLPGGVTERDTNNTALTDKASILLPGEDAAAKIKGGMFVKVNVNKTACYVGEPILVVYKLYTRLRSQSKVMEQPVFTGCSVYEMTTNDLFSQVEVVNGKPYKTYIIRKVQLIPLHAGPLVLGASSVSNEISFFKNEAEVRQDFPSIKQNITLTNEPLTIQVNDLPDKDKPINFTGAVGKFTISTSAAKTNDTAHDNNTLQVVIEGAGYFQNIEMPAIAWPGSVDHFEVQSDDNIDKMSFPSSGKKIFRIPFVINKPGDVTIPPIAFTYFDTESKSYKTAESAGFIIHSVEGNNKFGIDTSKISEDITNKKYLWIVPALAVIAAFAWWWNYGRKQPEKENLPDSGNSNIKEEPILNYEDYYKEKIEELLTLEDDRAFFAQAKQMASEALSKEKNGFNKNRLSVVIQQCNEALYATFKDEKARDSILIGLETIFKENV